MNLIALVWLCGNNCFWKCILQTLWSIAMGLKRAQESKALTPLPENPLGFPTPACRLTTTSNYRSRKSNALFQPPQASVGTHKFTRVNTQTHINDHKIKTRFKAQGVQRATHHQCCAWKWCDCVWDLWETLAGYLPMCGTYQLELPCLLNCSGLMPLPPGILTYEYSHGPSFQAGQVIFKQLCRSQVCAMF